VAGYNLSPGLANPKHFLIPVKEENTPSVQQLLQYRKRVHQCRANGPLSARLKAETVLK
jgi:hypothetical protein